MKQTLKLTGIYFKETLFGLFGGSEKKVSKKTLPLIFLLFAVLIVGIGFNLYNMADIMNKISQVKNIIIIGLLMAVFIALMITLNDTQGTMYKSKDYDMLMSLPLKSVSIITAKYLSIYMISVLFTTAISLPTFVVYFIFDGVTAHGIIYGLLSLLFLPAFAQLICCIVGWLVNLITSKMRNKNIIRSIFSLIMAVGLAVFISLANNELMGNIFIFGVPLWFKIIFSNIYFLFLAITTGNFLYFLIYVAISILFIALGVLVVSIGFKKINSSLMSTRVKQKAKPITYKSRTAYGNLLYKESQTFFNSPVYFVNGLIGYIMCFVITAVTLVTSNHLVGAVGRELVSLIMTPVQIFCVAMCTGIAPTTSTSISMEGSKLQHLKSLPIKFKDIILSKISLNLFFAIPAVILSMAIYAIVIKLGWLLIILSFVYVVISVIAQTLLGLVLNLKYPKLNWTSETQAVKGGASMLFTMIINMLISIIPLVLYLVLSFNNVVFDINLFIGICAIFESAFAVALILILRFKGEKMFNAIQV